LDGKLDENDWKNAPALDRLWELFPGNQIPAPERTETRFLYDDHFLYVGFRLPLNDPSRLRRPFVRRDRVGSTHDYVQVYLDPQGSGQAATFFRVNARCTQSDGVRDEAQQSETPAATGVSQEKLSQNFRAQHEIGHRFQIDPNDLPAPKAGAIVTNRSLIVPYDGQVPQVPPGFTATPLVTGLAHPRRLLVFPNGDILVAEQKTGYLTLLRDDGSGRAQWIERHVEDLDRPYGLAWRDGNVLVADQNGIWSVPQVLGALRAGRSETLRIDQVPPQERRPVAGAYGAKMITQKGVFGLVQGHQNRPLAIDPKSGALFVGVGSSGNLGIEPEPKATIQSFDATVLARIAALLFVGFCASSIRRPRVETNCTGGNDALHSCIAGGCVLTRAAAIPFGDFRPRAGDSAKHS
jgi:hypothetical protein